MDMTGEVRPESTVIVVTGGVPPAATSMADLPDDARVVAADSGADTALALGLLVHEMVGDFDSVSRTGLEQVTDAGASLERHEPDKDATDLELALATALRHDPTRILVLGGLGGRVDHELANLLLLSDEVLSGVDVELRSGTAVVRVVRPGRRATVRGSPGELLSLMPVHGPATGVTTSGLRWPLAGADLLTGTTLGISNEFLDHEASVACTAGVLLVVQPGIASAFVPPRASATPTSHEVSHDR